MVKSKNGARLSYNLNAGTKTNNNFYEETEVPQGLGSKANLSYEKDMMLSNGKQTKDSKKYFLSETIIKNEKDK